MKKISLALLGIILIFSACKKKDNSEIADSNTDNEPVIANVEPEQKQYALVLEYTATWCSACGSWGHETIGEIINYNLKKVVPVLCHVSDGISPDPNLFNGVMAIYPNDGGVPDFVINDVHSNSVSDVAAVLAREPVAQTNFTMARNGRSISVHTKTKFFKAVSGADYYLAVYALEDGIDGLAGSNQQTGATDPAYKHNHTLRASSCSNSALGEKIVSGSADEGAFISGDYSITCPANCNMSNVTVAAIIWKIAGDTTFVNAYEKK
ncbi:MAG: Omp28-related outer membrane protein [Bacteroidota bacterium]